MTRAIDNIFLMDLKEGKLELLLNIINKDDTLDLELRGDKICIYYRGALLLTIIADKGKEEYNYKVNILDDKYFQNNEYKYNKINFKKQYSIANSADLNEWIQFLPYFKQAVDYHFSVKRSLERDIQQQIVRENNKTFYSDNYNTTDYFILDVEYTFKTDEKDNARMDMVALKWESTSTERKNTKDLPLVFIELKCGDKALSNKSGKSDISGHLKDFADFAENSVHNGESFRVLCDDLSRVFHQKCELGLITGLKKYDVTIAYEKPEFIFIFANHDPDSSVLKKTLNEEIRKYDASILERIYIAKSSEMGYRIFNSRTRRLPNIIEYVEGCSSF